MVRTVEKKYQVWLAGYYDDFNGARAIPDDANSPGTTRNHVNSHHGNPMNGEATLNPRYRWAQPDRDHTGGNEYAPDEQKLLKNDGVFEFVSHDDTRQSNDEWEGRAQLQYPDGHVANRYRFGGALGDGYLKFVNGYDTLGSYVVPTGTNDATFGRAAMQGFDTDSYDTTDDAGVVDTSGAFVQRAHLAGVWMGEGLQEDSTTNVPDRVFAELTSPAKKPFLVVQSARYNKTNNPDVPTVIYDGALNTRLDGDTFTARIAVRAHKQIGNWDEVDLKIQIGFPAQSATITQTGLQGTPEIDYDLPLDSISYATTGYLYDGTSAVTPDNDAAWLDLDFVMNYTAGTFDVYYNGTSLTTGTQFATKAAGGTVNPENMYGWQMTVKNGESSSTDGYVSYLMLDRVGLVRYLTDNVTGNTDDAPITNLSMNRSVNGISTCKISVSDIPQLHTDGARGSDATNYQHNLKDLFIATSAIDWQLLVFGNTSGRIDRPLWRGIVEKFDIKQIRRDRVLTFQANDALSIMDRTVPLWEIGQESLNDNEAETNYWLYEAQGFKNTMNLGARELKLLEVDLGFDVDGNYIETSTQRTQLGSGHPVQMYNNEDVLGPNDVENYHEGLGILGFNEDASGNTEIHLSRSDHGLSGTPSITITNSTNHNGTYTASSVSGNKIVVAGGTLPVTGETAKIIYMGKANRPIYEFDKFTTGLGGFGAIAFAAITSLKPESADFPSGNTGNLHFIFDSNPGLKAGDNFYVNGRNIANAATVPSLYIGRHKVKVVEIAKSYFTGVANSNPTSYGPSDKGGKIYWVETHTPYTTASGGGEWPAANAYVNDTLANNPSSFGPNERVEFSKDSGVVSTVDEFPSRTIHARWMRDLPKSLWFQYHFGRIGSEPYNRTTRIGATSNTTDEMQQILAATGVTGDYGPTTNLVGVSSVTYQNIPNNGIAEIHRGGEFLGKFIYQGKVEVSSLYYLTGVKYMFTYTRQAGDAIRVQEINNDYKHIWLLWSDMRNNGKANADGLERKKDFGLQYPISDNYEFNLYFANQRNADGNLDMFVGLKNEEDISVWNVDATTDPVTGGAFSKPADYANPVSATIGESSGKLTITISSGDMTNKFPSGVDFVHLVGSASHDGIHTITGKTSTVLTTGTTHTASTYAVGSAAIVYASTGSDVDLLQYHDWENKGGAFLVIDTAPFYNLNTHINHGSTGRNVGRKTDLGDYVATQEGFPMLIDNYWREATPSYLTTGNRALEHPNAEYIVSSDATFATDLDGDGVFLDSSYKGLPVDNATIFNPNGGYGLMRVVAETTTNEDANKNFYFSYDSILTSELGSFSVSSTTSATLPSSGSYAVSNNPGVASYGGQLVTQEIVCNGETLFTDGVREGMVVERTKGGVVSNHIILNIGEADNDTNFETTIVVTGPGWDNTCTFTVDKGTYGGVIGTQHIVCNGQTLKANGIREGMVLERTKGGVVSYHSVLNMGQGDDDSNSDTTMVVTGPGWDNTCTFSVPPQLGKVFVTSLDELELDASLLNNERYPTAIGNAFSALDINDWSIYGLKSSGVQEDRVEVHPTFGSYAMLRLVMHMNGFIKSRNSGTFFESDKIRTLWNAAITDTWMPPTRLTGMYDINNVPNTSTMTTYNDTSSNDSYGSILDTKGKTLTKILSNMKQKSGFGDNNGLKTTFSYLVGRDGRIEFRPKFNSHLSFTRQNMIVSNFTSQMSSQISNIRVYYNGGASFVDFPKPGIADTTRWRIVEMPNIRNSQEALQVAKQEYNKSKNTPMQLTIEPILESDVSNKMIESGRYGYISDPYIALQSKLQTVTDANKYVTNWTRLGTGGVLFPGMVNALDGNQATTTDIYARYGGSAVDNGVTTVAYNNNYTWYGANSVSYAVQVVHATRNLPLVSANSGESLRIYIDLKTGQSGTDIENAEFTIYLKDYNFANNVRTATQVGSESVDVKHSGFYEISVPTSYDSSAGGKIVVSFNAEYCRALLRHRCGNPAATATVGGVANTPIILLQKANNPNTIFPLGMREYNFKGGTMDDRAKWYAPRVHICNDMAYHPATIVSITDPGIGLNTAESMVIKQINWSIMAGQTDQVTLKLERDESLMIAGLITHLYAPNDGLSGANPIVGGSFSSGPPVPPAGQPTPPSNPPAVDVTPVLPQGGTIDPNGNSFGQTEVTVNQQSSTLFNRSIGGRMDMRDLGNSSLSILGMKNEGPKITAMRGIEGSDVSIIAASGSAALTADGYVLSGKGRTGEDDSNIESQIVSLETQFNTPEDVVNDDLIITAKVSCGAAALGIVVLETTATIIETGTSVSNTVKISTNTIRQTVELLPLTTLQGLKNNKNKVQVKVVRKPGTGSDTAETSSVTLHNLDIRMNRASIPGKINSTQFSTFS